MLQIVFTVLWMIILREEHNSVQLIGCSLIWEIIFFMRLPRPIDVLTIRNKSVRIFRHVDNLHSVAESREKRNLTKKL